MPISVPDDGSGSEDPRQIIVTSPMSRAQIVAVAVTAMISALDGFDVLSITFAAPGVVRDFGVDKAALGLALSGGLVGMALGSLLLAPLADRFGRRALVLLSLTLMAIGMFASATAGDIAGLTGWRVLTGLGIGAMVAVINPLAAEYANGRRRELAVAIMAIGYPVGGVVGGALAAILLQIYDWRAIFILGGCGAVVLIPVVIALLPESIAFLTDRQPRNALTRVNAVLRRFGHGPLARLPAAQTHRRVPVATLFDADLRRATLVIIAVNFLYVIAVYFFLSWLPQMVVDAGFTPRDATGVAVVANLAGVVGGILLGWLAPRLGLKRLVVIAMSGMGFSMALFGSAPADLGLLSAAAGLTGFFLFAGIVGVYSVIARAFPPNARATGAGLVIGIGRGGSALAPLIAGLLFTAGLGRDGVSIAIGLSAVFAACLLLGLPGGGRMAEPPRTG